MRLILILAGCSPIWFSQKRISFRRELIFPTEMAWCIVLSFCTHLSNDEKSAICTQERCKIVCIIAYMTRVMSLHLTGLRRGLVYFCICGCLLWVSCLSFDMRFFVIVLNILLLCGLSVVIYSLLLTHQLSVSSIYQITIFGAIHYTVKAVCSLCFMVM